MSISGSKFQFWRVLVALAHQDHKVTQEERDFIVSKFEFIDFSPEQKQQLLDELDSRQADPVSLFQNLGAEQRAECLHMIHTIFTTDGNFDVKEQDSYQTLKKMHMNSLNQTAIHEDFNDFLGEQAERRKLEETMIAAYRDDNDFLSVMNRYLKEESTDPYAERHFHIWRVIIALAHIDHKIDPAEKAMISNRIASLDISESKKTTLLRDVDSPQDAIKMFDLIQRDSDQAECLYLAHALFGVDGDISPEEEIMHKHLKNRYIAKNLNK